MYHVTIYKTSDTQEHEYNLASMAIGRACDDGWDAFHSREDAEAAAFQVATTYQVAAHVTGGRDSIPAWYLPR